MVISVVASARNSNTAGASSTGTSAFEIATLSPVAKSRDKLTGS
jgi:hypothetical protein